MAALGYGVRTFAKYVKDDPRMNRLVAESWEKKLAAAVGPATDSLAPQVSTNPPNYSWLGPNQIWRERQPLPLKHAGCRMRFAHI